jgi:DNA-binding LacI/PurR family transcriptional regulator
VSVPKRVGIREVAERAGVSASTVSLVLNGRGRVGAQARERVRAAVVELGYRPNPSAQNLRSHRTGIVGIFERTAPRSSWDWNDLEFLVRITHALCSSAWAQGWYPTLLPVDMDPVELSGFPLDRAVVIDPLPDDVGLAALDLLGVPTVTMGRDIARPRDVGSWVDHDKAQQCREAVATMERGGARRILMISAQTGQSYMADNVAAFRELAAGTAHELVETPVDLSPDDVFALVRARLEGDAPVDGLYIVVEAFLPPVLEAIAQQGLSVPDDVQLISSSDSAVARSARVPVSTFDLCPDVLGRELIGVLAELDAGAADGGVRRIVAPQLVARGSTRG